MESLKHMLRNEIQSVRESISRAPDPPPAAPLHHCERVSRPAHLVDTRKKGLKSEEHRDVYHVLSCLTNMAIGTVRTCFHEKNGTPRQPGLCSNAVGSLKIEAFSNASHSLEGLEEYSHAW